VRLLRERALAWQAYVPEGARVAGLIYHSPGSSPARRDHP
jgi:hypothetical protein